MGILLILLPVVVIAAFMVTRHVHPFIITPVAALVIPIWAMFDAYIYPAEPKAQMWAPIAAAFGYAYGLAASAATCVAFAIARKVKRDV